MSTNNTQGQKRRELAAYQAHINYLEGEVNKLKETLSQMTSQIEASEHRVTAAREMNAIYVKAKHDSRVKTEEDWKELLNDWDQLARRLQNGDWEAIEGDFPRIHWPNEVEYGNLVKLGRYERELEENGEPPLWQEEAENDRLRDEAKYLE